MQRKPRTDIMSQLWQQQQRGVGSDVPGQQYGVAVGSRLAVSSSGGSDGFGAAASAAAAVGAGGGVNGGVGLQREFDTLSQVSSEDDSMTHEEVGVKLQTQYVLQQ